MDNRLQMIIAAAIGATIVSVIVFAAGWLGDTRSATVTCAFHHEGPEDAAASRCEFRVLSPRFDVIDEEWGEVNPGDVIEWTLTHKWRGDLSSRICIETEFVASGHSSQDVDYVLWDVMDFVVVSGGAYEMDCYMYTYDGDDDARSWDGYCVHPDMLDPFEPEQVGTLELSLHSDGEEYERYWILAGQSAEIFGVLGAQSSRNLTIPIFAAFDNVSFDCPVVVYSEDDWNVPDYSSILQMDSGDNVSLSIII